MAKMTPEQLRKKGLELIKMANEAKKVEQQTLRINLGQLVLDHLNEKISLEEMMTKAKGLADSMAELA